MQIREGLPHLGSRGIGINRRLDAHENLGIFRGNIARVLEVVTQVGGEYGQRLTAHSYDGLALPALLVEFHRGKHRVLIIWQMPAREIQVLPRDVRGADPLITGGELSFLGQLFQLLDEGGAAREPERQAGADVVVESEKLEFFPKLAMVALLRFLEHGEVFVELGAGS